MTARGLLVRLRTLLRRGSAEADLDEELRYHLERDAERGRGPAFGNVGVIKEEVRDSWGWTWLEQLLQDLRYGARALRRSPVFTAVAVLSLGLGIGANTAVFNLLHGILLTPLPVAQPERLVDLTWVDNRGRDNGFSYASFESLRQVPGVALAAERTLDNQPFAVGQAEDFTNIDLVGGDFYATLGLAPRFGRLIGPGEFARADHVAVLAEPFAKQWFGNAEAAVGKTISLKGTPFTIIGVAPAAWRGLEYPGYFTIAIPLSAVAALGQGDYRSGDEKIFFIVGRLAGPNRAATEGALDAAFRRCCMADRPAHIVLADMSTGIGGGKDDIRGDYTPALEALMAGVVVLLLIACANVGNLMLLRAAGREREIAVRLSLGSSRRRIVRQLLAESLLLGLLGVVVALLIARWAAAALVHALPDMGDAYPAMITFHPSLAIVAFTVAVGLGATILTGLVPALRSTRRDVNEALKASSRTSARSTGLLGRGLVAVQVALALLLVSCASLLVATLRNLTAQDLGVNVPHLAAMDVETRGTTLQPIGIIPYTDAILAGARRTSGVVSAGLATVAPLFGGRWSTWDIEIPNGGARQNVPMAAVSPGFFETMGTRLVSGRDFAELDGSGSEPVAIISRSLARALYGTENVVGRILPLRRDQPAVLRIVGVVADVALQGPRDGTTPMFYRPVTQVGPWPYVELVLRTRADDAAVIARVAAAARRAAPGVRIRNTATARDQLTAWLTREILVASFASVFGALALVLAVMGIYGVISYNVARRTGELGVRMALGARATDVARLVLGSSLTMTGLGLVLGAPLAWFATRAFRSMLYGVGAHDPMLLGLSVLVLLVAAVLAAAVPARRATAIDPLVALRSE